MSQAHVQEGPANSTRAFMFLMAFPDLLARGQLKGRFRAKNAGVMETNPLCSLWLILARGLEISLLQKTFALFASLAVTSKNLCALCG